MTKKPKKAVKKPAKTASVASKLPKWVSKPLAIKSRPVKPAKTAKTAPKKGKSMTKKQDNETQQDKEIQAKKDAKAAEKTSPYGAIPKPGSLDPGKTTMANPPPQNVPIEPIEPTDDPMETPSAAPLPNPPSRPGGDFAGEPNVSPTGEPLDPDHPDYRKDYAGEHGPDQRSEAEKKANPRK